MKIENTHKSALHERLLPHAMVIRDVYTRHLITGTLGQQEQRLANKFLEKIEKFLDFLFFFLNLLSFCQTEIGQRLALVASRWVELSNLILWAPMSTSNSERSKILADQTKNSRLINFRLMESFAANCRLRTVRLTQFSSRMTPLTEHFDLFRMLQFSLLQCRRSKTFFFSIFTWK